MYDTTGIVQVAGEVTVVPVLIDAETQADHTNFLFRFIHSQCLGLAIMFCNK